MDVLRFLEPRLQHGMIIGFDDYYCYGPSTASGERLAAAEFFGANGKWQLLPFLRISTFGMSFVVEDRSVSPAYVEGW
jgi:hypothetical protein